MKSNFAIINTSIAVIYGIYITQALSFDYVRKIFDPKIALI